MKGINKRILSIFILFFGLSVAVFAQTKDDVVNLYNKGVEMAKTDAKAAVAIFEEALEMAKAVGLDADDIKQLIESQIPALQYKAATTLYKEKKIDDAIENFELAAEYATLYGDDATLEKAETIIPKLLFSKGNSYYKAKTYDSALIYFDKSLELNPDYAKVYLSKGLVYKKQKNNDLMMESLEQALTVGTATNDEKTVKTANKIIRDSYLRSSNDALKADNFQEGIDIANIANTYGEQKSQTFYVLAVCYNKLSQWDNALSACNDGLALEKDTPKDKAKFYFEMGNAQVGKGDNATACTAYKNALFGNYKASAEYQINEVLKCQ